MAYRAPVQDIIFSLKHAAGLTKARADGIYQDLGDDDLDVVLGEAGRFASQGLAPLNAGGARYGTPFRDGEVTMPPGWKEAYRDWAAAGWNGVAAPTAWGGQGLPRAVNAACIEMWNSAAMAFGLGELGESSLDASHCDIQFWQGKLAQVALIRLGGSRCYACQVEPTHRGGQPDFGSFVLI